MAEADTLLAGIDDFLLDALGIAPPVEDTRRVFAVSLAQMSGQERLNSDYYHPERIRALRGLGNALDGLTVAPLAEVVAFEREQIKTPGDNYLSLAHVQSHTGELTNAADTASGNCFTFQTDDVLFARLRPYLNKVYCAEMNGCCSTEFHVLRVKDRETLLPEYLATILRSRLVLAQTTHMMTGNTHPRLTNYDVANLTIPIPSSEVQESIAVEIRCRRDAARQLRGQAEAGWAAAKGLFEAALLT
ncbi:MAG: restriction endonuclease subunit S [Dehalococcoidia bacterium]|nr:restriction endonuclease subunit S [Dehalococcoidia bacterium]